MNLSEHFTLEEATFSETAVRMGIPNMPSTLQLANMQAAAKGMEEIRALLGKPIRVNSWLRLPDVNVAVGGSKISSHMDGWAIAAAGIKFDQMIHEYARWTHISFAPEMRGQQLTIFRPQNKYVPGLLTAEEYAKHF
jgi:hypothetical protein